MRIWMVLATLAGVSSGCGGAIHKETKVGPAAKLVIKDATREELLQTYNAFAKELQTVNATVQMKPTAGSVYSGVIDEYHEVKSFLLAARPAEIRVIGQAPVIGKTIFDMTSDGETFRVSIPSKNKFLVGSVRTERGGKKPIENLRPQHLLDSLLWTEIRTDEKTLFEEFNDERGRYYVLTLLGAGETPEIAMKIWFQRSDLSVSRLQKFGPGGALLSDIRFAEWQALAWDQEASADTVKILLRFPRRIHIERPHDDYTLDMEFTKVMINGPLPAERFQLEQPTGSELVRVGESQEEKKP